MFDLNQFARYETEQMHKLTMFGVTVIEAHVKAGHDDDGDGRPDVDVEVTGPGGVPLTPEGFGFELPKIDALNPKAVITRALDELEKAGIDVPGYGKGL